MAVRLNHTIVAAHDHEASSKFLTEILGLPPPLRLGPFAVVPVGDTSLDYMNVKEYRGADGEIVSQHYAFLVTEAEFDQIFARISGAALALLGRPPSQSAGPDQRVGWRPRDLLRRSQRSCARSDHAALRQRRHDGGSTAPVARGNRRPPLKTATRLRP